jgi:predicted ATPase/DNA-binding SARP family transcriptional activator
LSRLELFCFGPLRLVRDGLPLTLERRKALALLAYLAVTAKPHAREVLATLFWPDYEPAKAYAYLRRALWELNNLLGEGVLASDRDQIGLAGSTSLWVDVVEFHSLVMRCPPGESSPEYLELLSQAAALYQGDFMAGFNLPDSRAFEDWQFFQAEELRQSFSALLDRLVTGRVESGDYPAAQRFAERWLALDGLNETAHRLLMQIYATQGDRSSALRQYERCVQLLQKELGLPPQPETTALYQKIKSGVEFAPVPPKTQPPSARPARSQASNLPGYLTPFIGRTQELEEIATLLQDPACRLLTLLGPGGIGKTRLAVQVAAAQDGQFADGVFFVSLAGLAAGENILPAIAKALRFSYREDAGEPLKQLSNFLRQNHTLLVLDNFEQLVTPENLQTIVELLQAAPALRMLVTTRASLNLMGEQLYILQGMHTPSLDWSSGTGLPAEKLSDLAGYSALQLFQSAAARSNPGLNLSDAWVVKTAQICDLVQGMPLAIELAAAWTEMLSPDEILTEIQHNLDFLEQHLHGLPERQRSLRAVFEASWNLLSPGEQHIFQGLSVFQGSFTRPAAQKVTGASLPDLARLVGKSLLQRLGSERFSTHELLRQYAAERLTATPEQSSAVHQAHSVYYLDLLSEKGRDLSGPRQKGAIEAIQSDLDNLRAAWMWAVEHAQFDRLEASLIGMLMYGLARSLWSGMDQVLEAAILALEKAGPPPEHRLLLAKILVCWNCVIYDWTTDLPTERIRRSLELVRETGAERSLGLWYSLLALYYGYFVNPNHAVQMLLENLAWLRESGTSFEVAATLTMLPDLAWSNPVVLALEMAQEAVNRFQAIGDQLGLARALQTLAGVYLRSYDYELAIDAMQQKLQIYQAFEDHANVAFTHFNMGEFYFGMGNFEQAMEHYRLARDIFVNTVGTQSMKAFCLNWESIIAIRWGDPALARQLRLECLDTSIHLNERSGIVWSSLELGDIERIEGNYAEARRLFEQAWQSYQGTAINLFPAFYHKAMGDLFLALGQYDQSWQSFEECARLAQEGFHTWSQVYGLNGMGRAAIRLGEPAEAQQFFNQALGLLKLDPDRMLRFVVLEGVAEYFEAAGDFEHVVAISAYVIEHPSAWQEMKDLASELVARSASRLPSTTLVAAQSAYQGYDPQQVIFEISQIMSA